MTPHRRATLPRLVASALYLLALAAAASAGDDPVGHFALKHQGQA